MVSKLWSGNPGSPIGPLGGQLMEFEERLNVRAAGPFLSSISTIAILVLYVLDIGVSADI